MGNWVAAEKLCEEIQRRFKTQLHEIKDNKGNTVFHSLAEVNSNTRIEHTKQCINTKKTMSITLQARNRP